MFFLPQDEQAPAAGGGLSGRTGAGRGGAWPWCSALAAARKLWRDWKSKGKLGLVWFGFVPPPHTCFFSFAVSGSGYVVP